MNRITEVNLCGFKGQHRTFELGARTILSGPNGLGKSAVLEAVRYALSGEVPTGKSLDEVAKYFTERGGHVELHDEQQAWIRRGIEVDHEKKKVSEKLELSDGSEWGTSAALLDMRGFLALSPNKRREFVLELVGAGEVPADTEVKAVVAMAYARGVAGVAASAETLEPSRLKDLPDGVREVAAHWSTVWSVFASYLGGKTTTASEIFQKLTEVARERKNSSRRAAQDAKSAHRELEAAAKGAEAAAAELEKRRYAAEEAADTFGAAREEAARRKEAAEAVEREEQDRAKLASRLEIFETAVVEDPGERPEVDTSPSEEADRLREEASAIHSRTDKVMAQLRELENARDYLSNLKCVLEQTKSELDKLVAEPIGRAVSLTAKIREQCDRRAGLVGELLIVVDELSASWTTRQENTAVRLAECAIGVRDAEEKHAELDTLPNTEEYLSDLGSETDKIEEKALALDRANLGRIEAQQKALEEWETKTNRATEVRTAVKALKERHEATRTRHEELAEKLDAMPDPPVRALRDDVEEAQEALQEAEEAAGAVTAYHDAIDRAKLNKVAEASWKAAEAACKAARESYVADIVAPIVADIGEVLTAAGREERVYLRLENDRGKPIFDLGWTLGDSRRSLSSLSGGEAVLFTTALALALARRSDGRRVLLLEADPLDESNLGELLGALGGIAGDQLAACLLATSTDVSAADGWKCVQFKHPAGRRLPAEPVKRDPTGRELVYDLYTKSMMAKSNVKSSHDSEGAEVDATEDSDG